MEFPPDGIALSLVLQAPNVPGQGCLGQVPVPEGAVVIVESSLKVSVAYCTVSLYIHREILGLDGLQPIK